MAKSNSNVFSFRPSGGGGGLKDDGGEPPGGDMEARLQAVEKSLPDIRERLVRVETKIDGIEKHGATKADLATMESTLIKWFVGTAFAMVGLASAIAFGLARYLS